MPESLTIAAFVFGAVLMLLSLVGGGFKLFGAEVSGTVGTLGRTVAFALGGVLITVGLLREDWSRSQPTPRMDQQINVPVSPSDASTQVKRSEPPPPPHINVNGIWRDSTWGTVSQITQQGETFRYTAWGPSCIGGTFQSSGSGTIRGNFVESRYQALHQPTIRSEGRCEGTVSSNGMQMTSTCNDSVCGQFPSSGVRQ
jgi:hypothetical protein